MAVSSVHAALTPTIVTEWMDQVGSIARNTGVDIIHTRAYAGTSLCMNNALNELISGSAADPPSDLLNATLAYAAHMFLTHMFPWTSPSNDAIIKKQLKLVSTDVGYIAQTVAYDECQKVIDATGVGFDRWSNYTPPTPGEGAYQLRTGQLVAVTPQFANVVPYVISRKYVASVTSLFKRPNTTTFKDQLAETQQYGQASVKGQYVPTNDNQSIALFWDDDTNGSIHGRTSNIGGHWINISMQLLPSTMTIRQQARYFAQASAAMHDSSIACWKLKYSQEEWRPETAINWYKRGSNWKPLIETPGHPGYPSNHACTVGAIYQVLLKHLGYNDKINLTIASEGYPELGYRNYTSLYAVAKESGWRSRVYCGVHVDQDGKDGTTLGIQIGKKVLSLYK